MPRYSPPLAYWYLNKKRKKRIADAAGDGGELLELASDSEVSAPAIAQVHAIAANDTESAGEVSAPTLTSSAPGTVPYTESTGDGTEIVGDTDNTFVTMGFAIDNGATIESVGVYITDARTPTVKIVQRNGVNDFDVDVSESFSHPGGGWADHTLSTPFVIPATGDFYVGVWVSGSSDRISGVLRAFAAGNVTGDGIAMAESVSKSFAVRVTGTKPA